MSEFSQIHFPTYEELPEKLVYLDELVQVVNTAHSSFPVSARNGHDAFTRSMATNYIKHGLTDSAIGKKYDREHVCRILFASTIKLVLQAADVHRVTHALFDHDNWIETYNSFATQMNSQKLSVSSKQQPVEVMLAQAVLLKISALSLVDDISI